MPAGRSAGREERVERVSLVLTALAVLTAVPAAVLTIPNAVSVLAPIAAADLGLRGSEAASLIRAYGLALPALMMSVPLAGALALRVRGWPVLLAGLLVLGCSHAVTGAVGSAVAVGALRGLQGVAAGCVLAGALATSRARSERDWQVLAGAWAAVLVISMIVATPLLYLLVGDGTWRAGMRPYPWLVGVALAAVAGLVALGGERSMPVRERRSERLLMFAAAPATLLAVLGVWSAYVTGEGTLLVMAVAALVVLFGMTALGGALAGRASVEHLVAGLAVGTVVLPLSSQVVNMLLPGFGGPGLGVVLVPAALATALALAGGLAGASDAVRLPPWSAGVGLLLAAGGSALMLRFTQSSGAPIVAAGLALLALGTSLALGVSLRPVRLVNACMGLAGCASGVLVGQLFANTLQLRVLTSAAAVGQRANMVDGLRGWGLVAAVVLCIAAADILTTDRRRGRAAGSRESPSTPVGPPGSEATTRAQSGQRERKARVRAAAGSRPGGRHQPGARRRGARRS